MGRIDAKPGVSPQRLSFCAMQTRSAMNMSNLWCVCSQARATGMSAQAVV